MENVQGGDSSTWCEVGVGLGVIAVIASGVFAPLSIAALGAVGLSC